jgi:hypothetical protein
MDRNILFNLGNKSASSTVPATRSDPATRSASIASPFSNTIPPQECDQAGFPISKYSGYGGYCK